MSIGSAKEAQHLKLAYYQLLLHLPECPLLLALFHTDYFKRWPSRTCQWVCFLMILTPCIASIVKSANILCDWIAIKGNEPSWLCLCIHNYSPLLHFRWTGLNNRLHGSVWGEMRKRNNHLHLHLTQATRNNGIRYVLSRPIIPTTPPVSGKIVYWHRNLMWLNSFVEVLELQR